jgi:cellulose synthase/poly-beta-1,6-N-acetylglucosamine synthase-like glycosyltransferase
MVLQILSGAFDDPRIGAATGYPFPGNANATVVSRYAALERWTPHLVVLAGKERLGLDPSIIGVVFAVRRDALDAAGGFPIGRVSEDIDLSMTLVALGWKLRWVRGAKVREDVVEDMDRFFEQRNRWGRGILQSASGAKTIESFFVVAGYLDRVIFLIALLLVLAGQLQAWLPFAYLVAPGMSALTAMVRARGRPIPAFVWSAIVMLAADLAVSSASTFGQLFGTTVKCGKRPNTAA